MPSSRRQACRALLAHGTLPPRRKGAPRRTWRAGVRRGRAAPRRAGWRAALLRLAGGVLFLAILVVYSAPVRAAARHAGAVVAEATAAGRLAAAHETVVVTNALRYGIPYDLAAAIEGAALAEGIDPELGFRLVYVESRFHQRAVSPAGALGLTQLMPTTADDLQPGITREEIFDRDTNLRLGFRYLRWLLRQHDGDVAEALHAYNRGPGTVARIRAEGGDPANGYAERVLRGGARLPYRGNGLAPGWPPPGFF